MEFFTRYEDPGELHEPVMLFAFAGWADAAESATHAIKFLVRQLKAGRFGEVDPEEFYDFTQVRPETKFDRDGERVIRWPRNEFYVHRSTSGGPDLVLFVGIEPSLRWRTFTEGMVNAVRQLGVREVVHVGALLDAVPHTRIAKLTGTATSPELRSMLGNVQVRRSRYTGPTGITGVFMDALRRAGTRAVSLWGHAPHYLQVSPNPKVSLQLVKGIEDLLDVSVDMRPLESQGRNFEKRVEQALADEPDVVAYVERLEAQWDEEGNGGSAAEPDEAGEMPDPEQAVRSIEEFLGLAAGDDDDGPQEADPEGQP